MWTDVSGQRVSTLLEYEEEWGMGVANIVSDRGKVTNWRKDSKEGGRVLLMRVCFGGHLHVLKLRKSIRDNRRISTDGSASKTNASHGKIRSKSDLISSRDHFIAMKSWYLWAIGLNILKSCVTVYKMRYVYLLCDHLSKRIMKLPLLLDLLSYSQYIM
jgi:hypothetical protein